MVEELSRTTLEAMITSLEPAWSLQSAERATEGTDVVYFVRLDTPASSLEAVLKACSFVDPAAFRPEPVTLQILADETDIPVPTVYGRVDEHESLPAPYFLMERRDGEVCEGASRALPLPVIERLARAGGRHLATLHEVGSFGRYGTIHCHSDWMEGTADPTADDLVVGPEGHDTWRDALAAQVAEWPGQFHERFASLADPFRAFLETRLEAVPAPDRPVFGNTDYRLGNLLINPETGETKAVIDWGNCHTTEPVYNLVALEEHLCGYATLDDPRRRRVRRAIEIGYGERTSRPAIEETLFEEGELTPLGECYYGVHRLAPLVWFSLWNASAGPDERQKTADRHHAVVQDLLERA